MQASMFKHKSPSPMMRENLFRIITEGTSPVPRMSLTTITQREAHQSHPHNLPIDNVSLEDHVR